MRWGGENRGGERKNGEEGVKYREVKKEGYEEKKEGE
jgi:hypothetical protein